MTNADVLKSLQQIDICVRSLNFPGALDDDKLILDMMKVIKDEASQIVLTLTFEDD